MAHISETYKTILQDDALVSFIRPFHKIRKNLTIIKAEVFALIEWSVEAVFKIISIISRLPDLFIQVLHTNSSQATTVYVPI